jgi:hypothetical protein
MNRQVRRDNERIINTVKRKAIKDTQDWVSTLKHEPTPNEIRAFQAGYLAGVNRGANNN